MKRTIGSLALLAALTLTTVASFGSSRKLTTQADVIDPTPLIVWIITHIPSPQPTPCPDPQQQCMA